MNLLPKHLIPVVVGISLHLLGTLTAIAEVNFSVLPVAPEGRITEETAKVIYRKTEQILTRNSAASAGAADIFAVKASLNVTGNSTSSGLVQDVTSISGEYILVALNRIDNTKFYSVSVPVKTASKGTASPVLALASAIKPTDPAYTRFVRTAREKIESFYSEHCEEIIDRAKSLAAAGNESFALGYLLALPASAPCHEEALELSATLRSVPERNPSRISDPEPEKEEGTFRNKEGGIDLGEPSGNGHPASPEKSEPDSRQEDSARNVEIFISKPDWDFKLSKAEYLPASRKIKLTAIITYTGKRPVGSCALRFSNAIDPDGDSYDRCYVEGSSYRNFPEDIGVKVEYYIDNVRSNPGWLSYVGLEVDYGKIELRNVTIK